MIDGNVNDFLDVITYEEAYAVYKDNKYLFYGVIYDKDQDFYHFSIDILYKEPINGMYGRNIYSVDCKSTQECITQFLAAKIFDGQSFYQVEKEMTWTDG